VDLQWLASNTKWPTLTLHGQQQHSGLLSVITIASLNPRQKAMHMLTGAWEPMHR
jgi:hypothetical protein